MTKKSSRPWFEIDLDPASIQRIIPPSKSDRFEGIDFSPSGTTLAIATSETNSVLLFRRTTDGRFEDIPYQTIGRAPVGLDYPHDVSFSRLKNGELLAVAQRAGAIAIYSKNGTKEEYISSPVFEISGPQSKLAYSDGVAFVPPEDSYLAACNLELGTISFFRMVSRLPPDFESKPEFEITHKSICNPDGVGFSNCGNWLAIANHGKQTVTVLRRRNRLLARWKLRFDSKPVTIIEDPRLRYPHSIAFTPKTNHLIVTNAGANHFSVYEPERHWSGTQWSQIPVAQVVVHDDETFKEVNTANKMEGGPKGVAINGNTLAVCSPQIGVKIYSFHEGWL